MKPAQQLLMAGAMFGALLTADTVRAQVGFAVERWACTETTVSDQKQQAREFSLQNDLLIEHPPGARYQLLANTMYGLVAVDHSADLELGYVDVFVSTMLIDKVTGSFIATSSTSGKPPEQRTGHCRMLRAEPAMSGAIAGKK
jgi:hypothetical protein